eukprot:7658160-Alexandrium_andersonii.AAC.1
MAAPRSMIATGVVGVLGCALLYSMGGAFIAATAKPSAQVKAPAVQLPTAARGSVAHRCALQRVRGR